MSFLGPEHLQKTNILEHDVELPVEYPVNPDISEVENPEESYKFLAEEDKFTLFAKIKRFPRLIFEVKIGGTLLIAWFALITGLLTVCTVGPGFKKLGLMGVSISLRPCWRSQITLLILAIPTFFELKHLNPESRRKLITRENLWLFVGTSSMWSISMIVWLRSLDYTSIPRASLLTNSYPIILVIWYKIRKIPLSFGEIGGTLVGFAGVGLTLAGGIGSSIGNKELIGDGLCIFVAVINAAQVLWGSRLRQTVQLFTYTFFTTLFMTLVTAITSLAFEGANFGFSGPNGLFAWVDPQFFLLTFFVAIAVGVIGVIAYNFALKHVPPLAYAVFKLLDPPFTGILAVMTGLDGIPGPWTFVGGFVTIIGIFIVQYGLQKRMKEEKEPKYNRLDVESSILEVEIDYSEENKAVELKEISTEDLKKEEDAKK